MIDPDRWARITGAAALMPLTGPSTLIRKDRSQSTAAEVVDPAVGRQHPGVADQHVEAAETVDGLLDDILDRGEVADVGGHGRHRPGARGEAVARLRAARPRSGR